MNSVDPARLTLKSMIVANVQMLTIGLMATFLVIQCPLQPLHCHHLPSKQYLNCEFYLIGESKIIALINQSKFALNTSAVGYVGFSGYMLRELFQYSTREISIDHIAYLEIQFTNHYYAEFQNQFRPSILKVGRQ